MSALPALRQSPAPIMIISNIWILAAFQGLPGKSLILETLLSTRITCYRPEASLNAMPNLD
jgi:hypothetical protein